MYLKCPNSACPCLQYLLFKDIFLNVPGFLESKHTGNCKEPIEVNSEFGGKILCVFIKIDGKFKLFFLVFDYFQ